LARNIVRSSLIFVKMRQRDSRWFVFRNVTTGTSGFGSLHIVAFALPIQAGFPLDAQ
jgi:hypothetical protein